jgi:hypothetical protein
LAVLFAALLDGRGRGILGIVSGGDGGIGGIKINQNQAQNPFCAQQKFSKKQT